MSGELKREDIKLILTSLLFGARLFRRRPEDSLEVVPPDRRHIWLEAEQRERELEASRAALDAEAIMKAVAASGPSA